MPAEIMNQSVSSPLYHQATSPDNSSAPLSRKRMKPRSLMTSLMLNDARLMLFEILFDAIDGGVRAKDHNVVSFFQSGITVNQHSLAFANQTTQTDVIRQLEVFDGTLGDARLIADHKFGHLSVGKSQAFDTGNICSQHHLVDMTGGQ